VGIAFHEIMWNKICINWGNFTKCWGGRTIWGGRVQMESKIGVSGFLQYLHFPQYFWHRSRVNAKWGGGGGGFILFLCEQKMWGKFLNFETKGRWGQNWIITTREKKLSKRLDPKNQHVMKKLQDPSNGHNNQLVPLWMLVHGGCHLVLSNGTTPQLL
jgi:hypothetical protein